MSTPTESGSETWSTSRATAFAFVFASVFASAVAACGCRLRKKALPSTLFRKRNLTVLLEILRLDLALADHSVTLPQPLSQPHRVDDDFPQSCVRCLPRIESSQAVRST